MQKVGILTLDGIVNYGNRLQNYALQKILETEGFKVDTIVAKGLIVKPFLQKVRTIMYDPIRSMHFIKFNRDYVNIRRIYARGWDISPEFSKQYDFFAVGSDQVWNPNIRKKERNNLLLKFAKPEQRVAVSASLSVSELNDSDAVIYKENISKFKAISTREFEGAEIIENICGREVTVLCDPTIALDRSEWEKIAKFPKTKIPKRYLLSYFLGNVNDERKESIEKYAKAHNLEIVKLNDKECKKIYNSGPCEFLGLIKNATVVCTDSFHGTAFSSIFNVPFWAFTRESDSLNLKNMESRIVSLQKKMGMSDRLIENLTADMPLEYDFTYTNTQIKKEQEMFVSFIRTSFELQEK